MMIRKKIQFVYFDIGGVLLQWRHVPDTLAKKYNRPVDDVWKAFKKIDDKSCRGQIDNKQSSKIMKEELHLSDSVSFDMLQFSMKHFTPILETHRFITSLHRRIPVGLLTNIHVGFYDFYLKHGHIPKILYSAVVESCVLGIAKPDKEIFLHAQKIAKVPHEAILFVDDQPENIAAALLLGWQTVQFDYLHPPKSIKQIEELIG